MGRTWHRDPGSCPFRSLPRATSLNPSSCNSTVLHSLPAGSWDEFGALVFERAPMSLADSHLSLVDRILTDFYSHMLCRYLFPALVLWIGEPHRELRPHTPHGEPGQLEIFFQNLSPCLWEWGQPVLHLCPSYQSLVMRVLFFGYKTSVSPQLVIQVDCSIFWL